MWPHELSLGPIAASPYGLMMALAAFSGLIILKRSAPLAGAGWDQAFHLAFWLLLAGLFGARAAYVLNHLGSYLARPHHIPMYWRGGLMWQGGLLGGLALGAILSALGRIDFRIMGDALAPGLALGQAVGRLGCLLQGCCHGRTAPAWFPLALRFPAGSQAPPHVPLYPTQPAEAAALALLAVLLLAHLKKRPRRPGRTLALYLALSGLTRLVLEFFRGDDRGRLLGLPPTTVAAGLVFAAGLWAWWRLGRPRPRTAGAPEAHEAPQAGA